jgi:formate hydrogenlyase subunit 3/multisubunit Na+/H+ antiporter MnhD subunit
MVLPLGLPDLPFHLRLDALSAFFLVVLGVGRAAVSLFSAGYFRASEGTSPGLVCLQYHVFLAAMALVLLADDAYAFMVAWERWPLGVVPSRDTDHRPARDPARGFQLPADRARRRLAIRAAASGAAGQPTGDYTFDGMRGATQNRRPVGPAIAVLPRAVSASAPKAGLLPLHVWLPEGASRGAFARVGADEAASC